MSRKNRTFATETTKLYSMFGFFRKKKVTKPLEVKVESREEFEARKKAYWERRNKIQNFQNEKSIEVEKAREAALESEKKECDEKNSTCPRCKSHNIISKFIDGSEVLVCKDCGNEFKISVPRPVDIENPFNEYSYASKKLYRSLFFLLHLRFDPTDILEIYGSYEEKLSDKIEAIASDNKETFESYKNAPFCVIEYLVAREIDEQIVIGDNNSFIRPFGYNSGVDDPYLYVMPEHVAEITKKIIGWEVES